MSNPKKPTCAQKELIAAAGLDPEGWLVRSDAGTYLKLVDRGIEQREEVTVNKETKRLVAV